MLFALAAATMLLAAAIPASAQQVTCTDPPFPPDPPGPPVRTCTVSTSAHTTHTSETLPGETIAAPGQPALTGQLQAALAGPNGAAIQSMLTSLGVLGPTSLTLISTETTLENTVTSTFQLGPSTILIGPDQGITFLVAPGTENININTHTETFIHDTFQSAQSLSSRGVNFLIGDLHTTFQTTLIDQGFQFIGVLLSRGSENGVVNGGLPGGLFSPGPLGFAPDTMGAFDFDGAMAFATKAPRTPMTAALGNGWRAWLRGSLGRATFDGTGANFGFRYRTASGEGGVERVVGQWMYGAAFGFGFAKVTQDATGDRGDIDTIRGGAYLAYRPGPWSITGALAVGLSNIQATRLSLLPVQARSDYHATTISAGVEAVRRIHTAHATFEPLAGLVYTGLRVDSFTETGTTFLDLAGSRAHIDALKGYAGGRVYKTYVASNGVAWTPEARGRLLYDLLDDPRGYTARFIADPAATPIAVTGLSPDRFAVMLGGALTARFTPTWRAFGSYDAEIRGGDVAHLVSAGVKGSW